MGESDAVWVRVDAGGALSSSPEGGDGGGGGGSSDRMRMIIATAALFSRREINGTIKLCRFKIFLSRSSCADMVGW